ncbi:glycosyltransferase [Marinobacter nauticus]|uniref:glycosyltransferase n=1 Tax=Marinobacter nauticus TaxID=2743 RepID=UPI001CD1B1AA|nr:glycosyltransferase [Marinobacter nauticus]
MSLPPQDPAFDSEWYLQAYPDVAQAGVDAWEHYVRHGKSEGRQPCLNRAEVCDFHLWRGLPGIMEVKLCRLLEGEGNELESDYARWALGRWYLWRNELERVADVLAVLQCRSLKAPAHAGPALVMLEALLKLGRLAEAESVWRVLNVALPYSADTALARCNVQAKAFPDEALDARLYGLNTWYAANGLLPLAFCERASGPAFDSLRAPDAVVPLPRVQARPLISVVVPVFNAGPGLETALRSLHQQTWPNLEVLIVDDASTDNSAELAVVLCERFSGPGRRFRLLRQPANAGAYAARNRGMAEASGEFLTVQDADDWSHPQKLEHQASALLESSELKASVSHWVRASDDMVFGRWRVEESWVYRNVSSLMVRRSVIEQLGFWEEVRVNADTEYYYRIMAVWGQGSIREVLPGVPLAFGRASEDSLSQAGPTHLITQFSGLRKNYMDSVHRWHASAAGCTDLYMARGQKRQPTLQDWFQQSGWFDAAWYVRRYPDLQQVQLDAFDHWWQIGAAEGRDPGPAFSTSGWARIYGKQQFTAMALAQWLQSRGGEPTMPVPCILEAGQPVSSFNPWIMVFGHQAGETLFGAERSLLDVLEALGMLAVNVFVVLPEAGNCDYVEQVRTRCARLAILPMAWWQQGAEANVVTLACLEHWLREYEVSRVYLNTVVHQEPALAARACGVRVFVHARELPACDPSLCEVLNASPEQVRRHALASADVLIANSHYLAGFYQAPECCVVPNVVVLEKFKVPMPNSEVLRVGMVSSNLPKKGLHDFVAVARELEQRQLPVACVLIGPDNAHVAALKDSAQRGELPGNLEFAGYIPEPAEAMGGLHVVLNLSSFEESFGRSVLEAMAAGRAVVCYSHGALPELVSEGETGYLVPRDVMAVADAVEQLVRAPSKVRQMGASGLSRVKTGYSVQVMAERLSGCMNLEKN